MEDLNEQLELMDRTAVAVFFSKSKMWVDRASKKGTIPPPMAGFDTPLWTRRMLMMHIKRLEEDSIQSSRKMLQAL